MGASSDIRHRQYPVFLVVGIAIALIVIGVAGSMIASIDQKLKQDAEVQVETLTKQAAANVSDRISSYENVIQAFSVQSDDMPAMQQELLDVQASFAFPVLAFEGADGQGCHADGSPFSAGELSIPETAYAIKDVEYSATCTLPDGTAGRYAIKPLVVNGERIGTVYAGISSVTLLDKSHLDMFDDLGYFVLFDAATDTIIVPPNQVSGDPNYQNLNFYEFLYAIQQDDEGDSLTQDAQSAIERSEVAKIQRAVANNETAMFVADIDGKARYVCVASIGRADNYLGSIVLEEAIRKEAVEVTNAFEIIAAIILACLIAVLVMSFFFYRKRMQEQGFEMKNHLYGALSDSLEMAVNMYSPDDSVVTPIVAKSREIVGFPMAELMGNKRIAEKVNLSEEGKDLLARVRNDQIAAFEQGEFSLKNPRNNQMRWIYYSVNPFQYEDKRQLLIIFRDITRDKNLQLSMNDAMQAAETANHAKSDFLSRMSHEIRTPMNAIIGMTAIAQKNIDDKDKVKASLRKITTASNHLLNLINDVLDISKIESGKMTITNEEFDLIELIEDTVSVILSQCEEKGQEFAVSTGDVKTRWFMGDRVRIQQLLINLLNNSVKYTPNGGRVSLTVTQRPSTVKKYMHVTFVVADNGIGMTEEYQKHIFEPFAMEGRSVSQGTGLGMPIVKNILTMINGEIQVVSQVDQGTTFTVDIDLERSFGGRKKPAGGSDENGGAEASPDALSASLEEPAQAGAERGEGSSIVQVEQFDGRHVLLAEDNELNAEIATELLHDMGLLVERASNGEAAYRMFEQSGLGYYDIVLMDIQMPVMNGYEATHCIRESGREDAKTVSIIAMSANAFPEDIQTSLRNGMDAHLSKPIDVRLVRATIVEALQDKG